MEKFKVGVIGVGRMGKALLEGLTSKLVSPQSITVFDVDPAKLNLVKKNGVRLAVSNHEVISSSDIVLLAVKPQVIDEVLSEIKAQVNEQQIIISIAAGITLKHLAQYLKTKKIFRVMPNNPSLVGEGIAAVAGNDKSSLKIVKKIFAAVGEVVEVKEEMMDAVTGLSGSGPAFVYLFIKGLIDAGLELGLKQEDAEQLTYQTVLGAVAVLKNTKKSPTKLIDMVKSPGGTTVEGLKILEKGNFEGMVKQAVVAAARRSKELNR